tara:strand:+ start:3149 stop:3970 length:822 start_codon:yes stop_codon:yes gene_type:complete
MKVILISLLVLLIAVPSAFAVPLADKTGMKFSFPVSADDGIFIIEGTGNFDAKRLDFNAETKEINLQIQSSLDYNLMEMVIPKNLLEGDQLTITLTYIPISIHSSQNAGTTTLTTPKIIHYGGNTIFLTLEFSGIGTHYLSISGIESPNSYELVDELVYDTSNVHVDSIQAIPKQNSLIITLSEYSDDAKLSITLEDTITPFDDGTFFVLVNDIYNDYIFEDGIMTIEFDSEADTIEIIGTHVVPEFAEIAPIVLATSLIGLIALRRYKKLNQ